MIAVPEPRCEKDGRALKGANTSLTQERPSLVLPRVPERRRSFLAYALAMSDSLIGGFDEADFREDITERKFLWFHHFLVNHPDGVKHILQDNAANYIKAEIVRPLLTPALGSGILTSEGEAWRRGRSIMAPAFNARSVATYAGIIRAATDRLIRTWDEDSADGPLDLEGAMTDLTLDIISQALFSSDSAHQGHASSQLHALPGGNDSQPARVDSGDQPRLGSLQDAACGKDILLIHDTPSEEVYVLNMFCMRGSRL